MTASIETTVCPIDAFDNLTLAREILHWMAAVNWAASSGNEKRGTPIMQSTWPGLASTFRMTGRTTSMWRPRSWPSHMG